MAYQGALPLPSGPTPDPRPPNPNAGVKAGKRDCSMAARLGVSFRIGAALACALIVAGGCGEPQADRTGFGGVARDLMAPELGSGVVCGDRLRWGVELAPGEELRLELEPKSGGDVSLALCSADRRARPREAELSLSFEVPGASGVAPRQERVFGWTEVQLEVPPGARALRLLAGGSHAVLVDEVVRRSVPSDPAVADRVGRGVLMISVDTLRADALGSYGGAPTPNLDRLAAESELHLRHYAASSWTKPSHASLLTGVPPEVHGADDAEAVIHPGITTLAERFAAAGWRTGGLVRHVWLDEKFGFARGFDSWRVVDWDAAEQGRAALAWIEGHSEGPFFYFLHLMTVHSDFHHLPYEGPGVDRHWVRERWGIAGYGCRETRCASSLLEVLMPGRIEPLPQDPEILAELYQRGVAEVDGVIGELLDGLEQLGLAQSTTVILTADHGEELLEHGFAMHRDWWEPVVRVPLLIRRPGQPRSRVPGPSASIDLTATVAAEQGLATDGLVGVPLTGRRPDRPVFSGVEWAVTWRESLKLIERPGAAPLLFDLAVDPGELVDLAVAQPEQGTRLAALRRQWLATLPVPEGPKQSAPLTEEEVSALRALGYLGDR